MLCPRYRTFHGFLSLIQKDWLSMGHKCANRLNLSQANDPKGKYHLSTGNFKIFRIFANFPSISGFYFSTNETIPNLIWIHFSIPRSVHQIRIGTPYIIIRAKFTWTSKSWNIWTDSILPFWWFLWKFTKRTTFKLRPTKIKIVII